MSDRSTLSRRALLRGLAASAAAAPLLTRAADTPQVAVIGAGAFGAWTALELQRRGARVTLVDAWGAGNARSSSGGESRVIRAVYGADRIYTEMVAQSYPLWRSLEAETGQSLYTPTGALWMLRGGDDGYLRAALPICEEFGFPVEELIVAEAARRWPQVHFDGVRKVYFEQRAGMLAARKSCEALRDRLVAKGGSYRTAEARPEPIRAGRMSHARLAQGDTLAADAFVFACGPWLGRLFPDIVGDALRPTRQEVFYFGPPAGTDRFRPEALPVWIDFGDRVFYGLPDASSRGFKLADDTRGDRIDPTTMDRTARRDALERARAFLALRFPDLTDAPLVETRVCQYENSPDGDLILDRHPEAENVWLAGGGSGHGFKLSPAVGGRLAAAITEAIPLPEKFSLARLSHPARAATQFEST